MLVRSNRYGNVDEEDGGIGKAFPIVVACGNAASVVLPAYTVYTAKSVLLSWRKNAQKRF